MASDQFCLVWNNFQSSILNALGNLQTAQDLVDVTLMCEGKNIRAHKVVLSACSPYFRNLFKETPCQHPVIILKDVAHNDLTALLQFMYQGEAMVTQDCLASFLRTAELLQISGLAGTAAAASSALSEINTDPPPRAPPDMNPPDSPGTAISKINSDLSLTKQKGKKDTGKDNEPKLPFEQIDPQQSCSYQSSPVIIKTESMDRDYDDMDTEQADELKDTEEHFLDNTSSHSEEPSILERSLKAQSGASELIIDSIRSLQDNTCERKLRSTTKPKVDRITRSKTTTEKKTSQNEIYNTYLRSCDACNELFDSNELLITHRQTCKQYLKRLSRRRYIKKHNPKAQNDKRRRDRRYKKKGKQRVIRSNKRRSVGNRKLVTNQESVNRRSVYKSPLNSKPTNNQQSITKQTVYPRSINTRLSAKTQKLVEGSINNQDTPDWQSTSTQQTVDEEPVYDLRTLNRQFDDDYPLVDEIKIEVNDEFDGQIDEYEQFHNAQESHDTEQFHDSEQVHDTEQFYDAEQNHDPEQICSNEQNHDTEQIRNNEQDHDTEQLTGDEELNSNGSLNQNEQTYVNVELSSNEQLKISKLPNQEKQLIVKLNISENERFIQIANQQSGKKLTNEELNSNEQSGNEQLNGKTFLDNVEEEIHIEEISNDNGVDNEYMNDSVQIRDWEHFDENHQSDAHNGVDHNKDNEQIKSNNHSELNSNNQQKKIDNQQLNVHKRIDDFGIERLDYDKLDYEHDDLDDESQQDDEEQDDEEDEESINQEGDLVPDHVSDQIPDNDHLPNTQVPIQSIDTIQLPDKIQKQTKRNEKREKQKRRSRLIRRIISSDEDTSDEFEDETPNRVPMKTRSRERKEEEIKSQVEAKSNEGDEDEDETQNKEPMKTRSREKKEEEMKLQVEVQSKDLTENNSPSLRSRSVSPNKNLRKRLRSFSGSPSPDKSEKQIITPRRNSSVMDNSPIRSKSELKRRKSMPEELSISKISKTEINPGISYSIKNEENKPNTSETFGKGFVLENKNKTHRKRHERDMHQRKKRLSKRERSLLRKLKRSKKLLKSPEKLVETKIKSENSPIRISQIKSESKISKSKHRSRSKNSPEAKIRSTIESPERKIISKSITSPTNPRGRPPKNPKDKIHELKQKLKLKLENNSFEDMNKSDDVQSKIRLRSTSILNTTPELEKSDGKSELEKSKIDEKSELEKSKSIGVVEKKHQSPGRSQSPVKQKHRRSRKQKFDIRIELDSAISTFPTTSTDMARSYRKENVRVDTPKNDNSLTKTMFNNDSNVFDFTEDCDHIFSPVRNDDER